MQIRTNLASLNAQRHIFGTNNLLDRSIERLSSGLRINSAADDASGLAIVSKMAAQTAGLSVALQNVQDGQALNKIAEGALAQINAMLVRMQELAVRATNGTLTAADREAVSGEIDELRDQITKIAEATEYNTVKLLNGNLTVGSAVNVTTGTAGSIRVTRTSPYMRSGSTYSFALTSAATAAGVSGTNAGVSASVSGIITVNGVEVSVASGDTARDVMGKINAVNGSTKVAAAVTSDDRLVLVSGIVDDEAKYVDGLASDVIGYALLGSAYTVEIGGDSTIIGDFGISGSESGTNASGTLDSAPLEVVGGPDGGARLRDNKPNSATYGIEITVDLYNGHNGVYIYDRQDESTEAKKGTGTPTVVHRSADGDAATVAIFADRRLPIQIGANYGQSLGQSLGRVNPGVLGAGGSAKFANLAEIRVDSVENANISLKVIAKAIDDVTAVRSRVGATLNRFDHVLSTLGVQRENLTAAQARLEDADISAELAEFTKNQIILQTGAAMLAQANTRAQVVLQLLQ